MTQPATQAPPKPMNFEGFLAFLDTRSDDERWELIDGWPVMSPQPTDFHQIIVANLTSFLLTEARARKASWLPLPGHLIRVPGSAENRGAVPDVIVVPTPLTGRVYQTDPLAAVEVMSPSNIRRDRLWRAKAYADVPSIRHYVIVEQGRVSVTVLNRDEGWAERSPIEQIGRAMDLPALSVSMPLAEVYRSTGFDPSL